MSFGQGTFDLINSINHSQLIESTLSAISVKLISFETLHEFYNAQKVPPLDKYVCLNDEEKDGDYNEKK